MHSKNESFACGGTEISCHKEVLSGRLAPDQACKVSYECKEENASCLCLDKDCKARECSGARIADSYEIECSTSNRICPGRLCIELKANQQNKSGICSSTCFVALQDCGQGAECIPRNQGDIEGICLKKCTQDSECKNGFVCNIEQGAPYGACLVRANP